MVTNAASFFLSYPFFIPVANCNLQYKNNGQIVALKTLYSLSWQPVAASDLK